MHRSLSKFQTLVEIPNFTTRFSYADKLLFIGSCFTENIGQKLKDLQFDVQVNPFGILYNPVSAANCLQRLLQNQAFRENELIQHNELFHSFSHHGDFSNSSKEQCLADINSSLTKSADFIKKTKFLFITFGTSWIYRHKKSGKIVANCHKVPANEFTREKLSIIEIVELYNQLIKDISVINPQLQVVFTVSPIRHLKDGAIENQRSKATLILSIEKLLQANSNCCYFPSYELVMDELRDYRFYASDMTHLTETAVNHIWEIFRDSLMEAESIKIAPKVQKLLQAKNHRPINRIGQAYRIFLEKSLQQAENIEKNYPAVKLTVIKSHFLQKLAKL